MVKNIFLFPMMFFALSLSLISCSNDDDEVVVDEEWKAFQEKKFNEAVASKQYYELLSQSDNGKILWKENTDPIVVAGEENKLRTTIDGKPEFTDTVVVRYEGWYYNKKGEKKIFDSTENPSLKTELQYNYGVIVDKNPNKIPATFAVNPNTPSSPANGYIGGTIDGLSTILQDMQVGEEREIVIPQQLGYGSSGSPLNIGNTSYTLIPAYTTLWFRLKLLKIIPMKGLYS